MWSRIVLKERAKSVLRKNYILAVIVSLVIAFAGGSVINKVGWGSGHDNDGFSWREHISYNTRGTREMADKMRDMARELRHADADDIDDIIESFVERSIRHGYRMTRYISGRDAMRIMFFFAAGLALFMVKKLARIFIGYSLEVGGRKFFVQSARGDSNLGYIARGFTSGHYANITKTMFLRDLYTVLWSLLFFIPGIIKGYAYSMVPYILADNPEMKANDAIALSCRMTHGHKLDMFVLQISFIGWYILGAMLCGLGVFLVRPYEDATLAELYLTLRGDEPITETPEVVEAEVKLQ